MDKISLYEISEALMKVEEMEQDDETLTEYLDSIKMDFKEKANNIVRYRRSLELTSEAIKSEIDRLTALKKGYDLRGEKMKNYLSYTLLKTETKELETEVAKLSFRKSEAVSILDDSIIPEEFTKEIVSVSVDKTAIKKAIKEGRSIDGAELIVKQNLQIK